MTIHPHLQAGYVYHRSLADVRRELSRMNLTDWYIFPEDRLFLPLLVLGMATGTFQSVSRLEAAWHFRLVI